MPSQSPPLALSNPWRTVFRPVEENLAYLGGAALLGLAALGSLVPALGRAPRFLRAVTRHLADMLGTAFPLATLVCIPLGSFLPMQAFFRATFTDAAGAITVLGLLRNLAPMATGMTLAAVLASRIIPELRSRPRFELDDDPLSVPDRSVARGFRADDRERPGPGRLAASRIVAAALAGPTLALWGTAVGGVIGMLVARSLLGVSPALFVGKFLDLLRPIDTIGLVVKGVLFAACSALFACHEGLSAPEDDADDLRGSILRAIRFSLAGILFINGSWFTLAYMGSSPFGPAVH